MADLMQRERKILADAWVQAGWPPEAAAVLASGNDTQLTVQLSAIAAAIRAAPAWQPIETAPRDGAPVWAFNGEQAPMLYIAGEGYALWIWADQVLADVDPSPEQPTHWMPLPEPPLAARPQGMR